MPEVEFCLALEDSPPRHLRCPRCQSVDVICIFSAIHIHHCFRCNLQQEWNRPHRR